MIDLLLDEGGYSVQTLARAIGAYPKTINEVRSMRKQRLQRKQALALIDLYCRSQVDAKI